MKVENWCIVTMDDADVKLCRTNNGQEVLLSEKTTKVVIKVEKSRSALEDMPKEALEAMGIRKAA